MLCSIYSFSQVGGQHAYQFLDLVNSPRQAALGGKNITIFDFDPTSGTYNPASINAEMHNQLSLNYVSYIGDVKYGTANYARTIDSLTFHTGVTYVNYGTFDGYDEFGNATSEFTGSEVAVSLGTAYNIPNSDFYVGANIKVISSKLEQYSSLGGAIDFGVNYLNENSNLIISLVARNAGMQFTSYDETKESLPFEVIAGISKKLENVPVRWHLTLENLQQWDLAFRNTARDEETLDGNVIADDPGFFNNVLRHTILGAEIFPDGGFNIRVGYSFRRSEELRIIDQRSFAGLSGGFSIKFNKLRFSYSYARYNAAASSSFFGLNVDL